MNGPKTHCRNGHLMAGDNLVLHRSTDRIVRRCRTCRDAVAQEQRVQHYRAYRERNPDMFGPKRGRAARTHCRKGHEYLEGTFRVAQNGTNGSHLVCLVCKRQNASAALDRARDRDLRKRYGMGAAEYAEILAAQQGRCAICGDEPDGRNLHVDHDHTTGRVRGLLCGNCNSGIGNLRDDPVLVEAAARYLRRALIRVAS